MARKIPGEAACPHCGGVCAHVNGWTLAGLRDTFACPSCGVTEFHLTASAS